MIVCKCGKQASYLDEKTKNLYCPMCVPSFTPVKVMNNNA